MNCVPEDFCSIDSQLYNLDTLPESLFLSSETLSYLSSCSYIDYSSLPAAVQNENTSQNQETPQSQAPTPDSRGKMKERVNFEPTKAKKATCTRSTIWEHFQKT